MLHVPTRVRRPVRAAPATHRPLPPAEVPGHRQAAVRADAGRAQWADRTPERARPHGRRAQPPGAGRHDLPHLLHDQAPHQHRADDAGRRRSHLAGRSRASLHPAVARSRRLRRRLRRHVPHAAHERTDARHRPDATHVRADLRLPAAHECRRRIPQAQPRRAARRRVARSHDRGAGEGAAGVLAGQRLQLLGLDRRRRLPGRQGLGPAVRAVPAHAHSRSAGHGGHGLHGARREGIASRSVLRSHSPTDA